ncbi:molybdopterin cofactor-binding domain-containing protein [Rhodovulum sp. DZ06]|uniref:xanthine dehydrogenase family protein molybdopterin-binding subunit n=1 Tax=Rhodovulum sp. DZ06 TaxID=3425126 RepID=UPI003D3573D1
MGKITRRIFMGLGAAAVGGLAVGYYYVAAPHPNPLNGTRDGDESVLNPWLVISAEGEITVIAPRAEMGQGVHTGLATLVAEELGVQLSDVTVEHGPAGAAYYNGAMLAEAGEAPAWDESWASGMMETVGRTMGKVLGLQGTGGSTSVVDAWDKMRKAGAAARIAMAGVASERLGVPADRLVIEGKAFKDPASGRAVGFGELAAAAAEKGLPDDPALTPREDWRLIGRTQERVDIHAKVTGAPIFGIDVELPQMLHATVKMSPVFGGKPVKADEAAARAVPGVVKVVPLKTPLGEGYGVIARNTWAAFQGAEALAAEWPAPAYPASTDAQFAALSEALDEERHPNAFEMGVTGDAPVSLRAAPEAEILSAEYRAPMLAHACMEPMNATAQLVDGTLKVWSGNQSPTIIQDVCGPLVGLSASDVEVATLPMGGGFGRRFEVDVAMLAAQLSQHTDGRPVKMTWTREEDMSHDMYRPPALGRFRAHVRRNEGPTAIEMRVAAPHITKSVLRRTFGMEGGGPDKSAIDGLFNQPFFVPNADYQGISVDLGVPVGFWRSVGNSQNGFFHQGFMDEIAHRAALDPLEMRLKMMDRPEFAPGKAALERVAAMSGWGESAPGRAKGVALCLSFGTWVAEVVEVSEQDGAIKLENVWCVADPGTVVDPGNFRAQMEGGIIFGLSAAMMQRISLEGGQVQELNFDGFDALRMASAPAVHVELLENSPFMGGAGEPGTPPAAPALANAIFALTGKRLRAMPFSDEVDFV